MNPAKKRAISQENREAKDKKEIPMPPTAQLQDKETETKKYAVFQKHPAMQGALCPKNSVRHSMPTTAELRPTSKNKLS